jgi:hypothetical protein
MTHIRELHLADVPTGWADGSEINVDDRLKIALLRVAGCRCEFPIIRTSVKLGNDGPEWNDGPRCKGCDTQVFFSPPTMLVATARIHMSHRSARRFFVEKLAQGEKLTWLTDLVECKPEHGCKPGCGCDYDDENLAVTDASGARPAQQEL